MLFRSLIVTLEPCCHHGRTPPCADAVISAGVARVVVALRDPDPRVAGGGIARLRAAGLEVITGVAEAEAREQNRAFLHRVVTGRPLGILKWAMSLDGRTALPNGESQWISGPEARGWVHRLRSTCDAVIVGGGTVRADDPLLTSRGRRDPEPLRVVISRTLNLPVSAQLWDTTSAPTLVAHGPEAPRERREAIDRLADAANPADAAASRQSHGAVPRGGESADHVRSGATSVDGGADPGGPRLDRLELPACEPLALLEALAQRGCNQVLWECGPELAAAAIRQDCVQELAVVIAPKLLGGVEARTPIGDLGLTRLDQAWLMDDRGWSRFGADHLWCLRRPIESPS